MRVVIFLILLLLLGSCATKKDTGKQLLPEGITWATQETYLVLNQQKKLLQKKQMVFTRDGYIKYSKTVDSLGNLIQETEKKWWFVVEKYPNKEAYYRKTRWKPNQRERISCYTQKQYKQNEAIYHYNPDGTITKIVDNFSTFYTQYYYYTNKSLTKIVTKDKNNTLLDEVNINCETHDDKGACVKEVRISTGTKRVEEVLLHPTYE